jgi:hypothetical protein
VTTLRLLRHALLVVLVVTTLVLFRSVLLERWITVIACAGLYAGAFATIRGRTWGVLVMLAFGTSFTAAALLMIGPAWFVFVTLAAATPAIVLCPHMFRFDRVAATAAITLALLWGTGSAAAVRLAADSAEPPRTVRLCR